MHRLCPAYGLSLGPKGSIGGAMEGEERRRDAWYLERELERLDFSDVEDRRGEHGEKEWGVK
jgi:hypothetical protein